MECEKIILHICFVKPTNGLEPSIFTFANFISALALLVIVYQLTDIRYRFRLAIAPIPLFRLTYVLIGIIGFATLLTDIWLKERWLVPKTYFISQSVWQGVLGFFFLLLFMTWIFYAFIKPPIFCKKNGLLFVQELYRLIVKGSDAELSVISNELGRSAKQLVMLAKQSPSKLQKDSDKKKDGKKNKPGVGDYANDILLMIGNRKLCRHIMASSPVTAIIFFEAMTTNQKYNIPIEQFAVNISTEAILNKDSILYHEDEGYRGGLIGYVKPFSQAIYGNYQLVENLGFTARSPLDIQHQVVDSWDASQLKSYSKAILLTLKNYFEGNNWRQQPYPSALYRAFDKIESSCYDVYKLNDISSDYYSTDIFRRLQVTVDFVHEAIEILNHQNYFSTKLRVKNNHEDLDLYDHIIHLMLEIILSASSVTGPPEKCWMIHYNLIWEKFFIFPGKGKAWDIIHFKLRRKLYDEILRLEKFPNYKSSKILGFSLNVMGLEIGNKSGYESNYYALHKVVLTWVKNNYLRLKKLKPEVAKSCLIGSINFDARRVRLVKTFNKGLNLRAPKDYLKLIPIKES
jgi:hypothetical protein